MFLLCRLCSADHPYLFRSPNPDAAKKERYVWGPYPAGLPPSISVAALRARESGSVPLIHPKEPPRLVLTQTPTPVQAITRVPMYGLLLP